MPTPYTNGNGCAYCRVNEILVGSADSFVADKVKKTLECTCQGPEVIECYRKGLQEAMFCEHFKPENEEFDIYVKELREKIYADTISELANYGKDDPVNHPSHYTAGGIECIDAIAAALSCHEDPVQAWLTGQCIKYLWRWPMKNGIEDLKKCRFYLDRLIKNLEEN